MEQVIEQLLDIDFRIAKGHYLKACKGSDIEQRKLLKKSLNMMRQRIFEAEMKALEALEQHSLDVFPDKLRGMFKSLYSFLETSMRGDISSEHARYMESLVLVRSMKTLQVPSEYWF